MWQTLLHLTFVQHGFSYMYEMLELLFLKCRKPDDNTVCQTRCSSVQNLMPNFVLIFYKVPSIPLIFFF